MFDSLSTRIQDAFKSLRGEVRLTPEHVETALREIRLALLEADVNFKVVKAFIDRVRDRAMDQAVLRSLTPGQQVISIVRDELLALFGDTEGGLKKDAPTPRVVLLLGLQGSGKTTTSGKLGKWLIRQGRHPLMVSTDVRRPAAIEQLSVLGEQADIRVHAPETMDPVARAKGAVAEARATGFDTVIVDTAGRLHIDDDLMDELQAIKDAVQPSDLLYVADAMTGQDAIKSAGEFNRRVGVTGVVLTKLDGDARGGAALSVVSVVGVPIAFVGSGERLEDLELFHPDRIVSRMLGMGDVLSLIEKAEQAIDEDEAAALEEKLRKNEFTLDDFRNAAEDDPADGAARKRPRHDPRARQPKAAGREQAGREADGAHRGDHLLDDAGRAARSVGHERQPPQADRGGQRHHGGGGQPAPQAVHRDAPRDADDRAGRHGRSRQEHEGDEAAEDGAAGRMQGGGFEGRRGEEAEEGSGRGGSIKTR